MVQPTSQWRGRDEAGERKCVYEKGSSRYVFLIDAEHMRMPAFYPWSFQLNIHVVFLVCAWPFFDSSPSQVPLPFGYGQDLSSSPVGDHRRQVQLTLSCSPFLLENRCYPLVRPFLFYQSLTPLSRPNSSLVFLYLCLIIPFAKIILLLTHSFRQRWWSSWYRCLWSQWYHFVL